MHIFAPDQPFFTQFCSDNHCSMSPKFEKEFRIHISLHITTDHKYL